MNEVPGSQRKRVFYKGAFGRTEWVALSFFLLAITVPVPALAQRVLGIDVSAWQGNISTANWATLKRATNQQVGGIFGDGRDFVFIRSSRGGTTGYYNQSDPDNNNGLNTLSQRYDDPYFVQNITRATAAGMVAGPYHFARPDVIETTQNSGGIANTGEDEANHMIEMAGAWMRPGYLLPVLDLEAGQSQRSSSQLSAFAVEFSDRIHAVMGIRPMIYLSQNYANYVNATVPAALPNLWIARWPNQSNPSAIDVQNIHPPPSPPSANVYGKWNPNFTSGNPYPDGHPWVFWQYASTARLNGYANGSANIDVDVAQGGMEFVKDYLVPALWVHQGDGQWTTLTNWNSGLPPVAPVQGPGQVARFGPLTLPSPRLPGSNDTVVLERASTNFTVSLASGTHQIRKLHVHEELNISGGSLTIQYVPSADSTPYAARFSGPVHLSGGTLAVHTLQVDGTQLFTVSGGSLAFGKIILMPDAAAAARLLLSGNVGISSFSGETATIARGSGAGSGGLLDLDNGHRAFNVADGPADVDLSIDLPMINGALAKTGPGTMRLTTVNGYTGGTTVSAGELQVNNPGGWGTGSGAVLVNAGRLRGTGFISGPLTINSLATLAPGTKTALGRLTLHNAPVFHGTNLVRIERTGPLADQIVLSSGTLPYGGTLVVSNAGPALLGGEVFTNYVASSYSGSFSTLTLPALSSGLNWYTGGLTVNGTIRVNRRPVTGPMTFTNIPPAVLEIPLASLLANAVDADGDSLSLASVNLTTTNGVMLATNSTSIYYSNYVSVADRFSYVINDGRGGQATGTVQIAASPAGRFASRPLWNGHSVALDFVGHPGSTYYLERSTNLPQWKPIWTNTAPGHGRFGYTDTFNDLGGPPRAAFYRLRSQ